MSKLYKCRPSELIALDDPYTAFCFDEACMFIRTKIDDMKSDQIEKLNYIENRKDKKRKKKSNAHYKSMGDFVKDVID